MLFLLTGSAGSGKSAALRELSTRRGDLSVFDVDDLRPPVPASRQWWHEQMETRVRWAIAEQAAGRDTALAGWLTIDEVIAVPSSGTLHGIAVCLLDCDDGVRRQRVEERAASGSWRQHTEEEFVGFLAAATEMRERVGSGLRLDTSSLSVQAVADRLEEWMASLHPSRQ